MVQQWIYGYRAKPDYAHVPAAVRVLFHSQTFNSCQGRAARQQLLPRAAAIAYSGLPDWRNLLRQIEPKIPERRIMIESYLDGTLPTLAAIPLEDSRPGMLDKLRNAFTRNPFKKEEKKLDTKLTFASSQDLLDTLWGYYFATGSHVPIMRIVQMLPWSKSRDTLDKLTVRSMARYTLASYAVRDSSLREFLRDELSRQSEAVKGPLTEVIQAADRVELGAVRRDALAAVEELKAKGSDARRNLDLWGQVGVGAIALGCVSAAAPSARLPSVYPA